MMQRSRLFKCSRPNLRSEMAVNAYRPLAAQVRDWQQRSPVSSWLEQFRGLDIRLDGRTILDCGCGPGHYGPLLASAGATVVGLDAATECLSIAGRATPPYGLLVHADARALPLRAASFDVVLLRYLIHHVAPAERTVVLRNLSRVLKPAGSLVIETSFPEQFRQHHDHAIFPPLSDVMGRMYPPAVELEDGLASAGFTDIRRIATQQVAPPYESVRAALKKSSRLVDAGEGPTAWLRLAPSERQAFHAARTTHLPRLFGEGPVPRVWFGSFVVAMRRDV